MIRQEKRKKQKNNGITLINGLRNGLNITKDNFIKENIHQFSAHYQSVKEYEEANREDIVESLKREIEVLSK